MLTGGGRERSGREGIVGKVQGWILSFIDGICVEDATRRDRRGGWMSLGRFHGIEAREKLMVGFREMRRAGVMREILRKSKVMKL